MFSKSDLTLFAEKLVSKRAQLIEVVQRSENYGREIAGGREAQDLADRASSSYTKEFLFNKSSSDRIFLQQVDEALLRVKSGSFGECTRCEELIRRKRLEALPWARLCFSCQQKAEKG